MDINSYIAKQFAAPKGLGGSLVSYVMNRQNRPLYEETIRLLPLSPSDHVLDIGCGNGFVLALLARRQAATYAGIDPAKQILATAARRNRQFVRDEKMSFSCGDVSAIPFADESFSKAYTINTVYFWDDLGKAMLEIRRVLQPGGIFINTLYSNETLARFSHTRFGYKRYERQQLLKAASAAGFHAETIPILQGSAYCCLCQKEMDEVI